MQIKYVKRPTEFQHLVDIWKLLFFCEEDVLPPLSYSPATAPKRLAHGSHASLAAQYREILSNRAILATEENKVIGFLSFNKNSACDRKHCPHAPYLYITTLLVHPAHRRMGVGTELYAELIKRFPSRFMYTEVPETNMPHIKLLHARGFTAYGRTHRETEIQNDKICFSRDPHRP